MWAYRPAQPTYFTRSHTRLWEILVGIHLLVWVFSICGCFLLVWISIFSSPNLAGMVLMLASLLCRFSLLEILVGIYSIPESCNQIYIPRPNLAGMVPTLVSPGLASGFGRAGVPTGGPSWQVLWRGWNIQKFSLFLFVLFFCLFYICLLWILYLWLAGAMKRPIHPNKLTFWILTHDFEWSQLPHLRFIHPVVIWNPTLR